MQNKEEVVHKYWTNTQKLLSDTTAFLSFVNWIVKYTNLMLKDLIETIFGSESKV
jgi:hypothetical protein